jgi:hypothetical protein
LTDANFVTILSDPYVMTDISDVSSGYEGITTFHIVTAESDYTDFNYWVGIKAQPWPAAAWSESFRFEKGDKATGYIFNKNGSGADKWYDETMTLNDALNLSMTLATVGSFLAMAMF